MAWYGHVSELFPLLNFFPQVSIWDNWGGGHGLNLESSITKASGLEKPLSLSWGYEYLPSCFIDGQGLMEAV